MLHDPDLVRFAPGPDAPAAPPASVVPAPTPAPKPAYTIEHNQDGSAVVKLRDVVRYQGEDHTRLTIPAMTGKHMRRAAWSVNEGATVGDIITFANEVVIPAGIVDEMPAWLARDVSNEVITCLGKGRRTGPGSSPG
jgi:hypothetical protein